MASQPRPPLLFPSQSRSHLQVFLELGGGAVEGWARTGPATKNIRKLQSVLELIILTTAPFF